MGVVRQWRATRISTGRHTALGHGDPLWHALMATGYNAVAVQPNCGEGKTKRKLRGGADWRTSGWTLCDSLGRIILGKAEWGGWTWKLGYVFDQIADLWSLYFLILFLFMYLYIRFKHPLRASYIKASSVFVSGFIRGHGSWKQYKHHFFFCFINDLNKTITSMESVIINPLTLI